MLTERCHWLRLPQFQAVLRKLGREGTRGAKPNYRKMSVSLKSGQKLVPRFLERAANLGGKVFHKFCRLQQTLRGD